mmetsp:Transcript_23723/g.77242  ORF Transcript_23723/g.77242 Transcript_23723/m.77242 type:complete len:208 (+) Transcript_23723:261-884(+)
MATSRRIDPFLLGFLPRLLLKLLGVSKRGMREHMSMIGRQEGVGENDKLLRHHHRVFWWDNNLVRQVQVDPTGSRGPRVAPEQQLERSWTQSKDVCSCSLRVAVEVEQDHDLCGGDAFSQLLGGGATASYWFDAVDDVLDSSFHPPPALTPIALCRHDCDDVELSCAVAGQKRLHALTNSVSSEVAGHVSYRDSPILPLAQRHDELR